MTKHTTTVPQRGSRDPAPERGTDSIRITLEGLKEEMIPRLREIIRRFENREIDKEEATKRVEEIRTTYTS